MELPIDHFRLLGVSPASDVQAVLRALDQRLDRVPDQGFTTETLQARARLLQESADLLSDEERRHPYEAELLALSGGPDAVAALDIPGSLEVAGLLLLLEAGQPQEAFDLACRALQPPQAPALGSGREADLSLLAGLACRAAAEESRGRRHFEAAARQLQQGLQLLQRMGQLPELRQRMARDLDALSPFLILDLLSRELTAVEKRREGLELLEQLVQRRGGLEGHLDPGFSEQEFQAFFKQIRSFLTVQEQVDLFSRWAEAGSGAADFLGTIALTASGFVQRKPERIAAARQRLQASGREGIEPLLANLHLLLGEVDIALATFAAGASRELHAWAERQSSEPLAQLCAYCRDWLANDVLPGYRDLEADPDLDAYFADRDVSAWVEREDRRSGRHYAPQSQESRDASTFDALLGTAAGGFGAPLTDAFDPASPPATSALGSGFMAGVASAGLSAASPLADSGDDELGGQEHDEVPIGWPGLSLGGLRRRASRRTSRRSSGLETAVSEPSGARQDRSWPGSLRPGGWPLWLRWVATAGLGLAAAVVVLLLRPRAPQPPARGVVTLPVQPAPASGAMTAPPAAGTSAARPGEPAARPVAAPAPVPLSPLQTADPSDAQLRRVLQDWLDTKAEVLAGGELPAALDQIARRGQIEQLRNERRADDAAAQRLILRVRIEDIRVIQRSPGRLALQARLRYSDERRDAAGRVVETTPPTTLRNVYVFGRDGDRWRLAATRSGG